MTDNGPILITGAAGQLGAVGRTVNGLLLERGLSVRALVRPFPSPSVGDRGGKEASPTQHSFWDPDVD